MLGKGKRPISQVWSSVRWCWKELPWCQHSNDTQVEDPGHYYRFKKIKLNFKMLFSCLKPRIYKKICHLFLWKFRLYSKYFWDSLFLKFWHFDREVQGFIVKISLLGRALHLSQAQLRIKSGKNRFSLELEFL